MKIYLLDDTSGYVYLIDGSESTYYHYQVVCPISLYPLLMSSGGTAERLEMDKGVGKIYTPLVWHKDVPEYTNIFENLALNCMLFYVGMLAEGVTKLEAEAVLPQTMLVKLSVKVDHGQLLRMITYGLPGNHTKTPLVYMAAMLAFTAKGGKLSWGVALSIRQLPDDLAETLMEYTNYFIGLLIEQE